MLNNKRVKFRRGNIVYVDFGKKGDSSRQEGVRPACIISNDKCNQCSPIVTVIPITSKQKKMELPTHISIKKTDTEGLQCDSVALIEQITSIDKKDIKWLVGLITNKKVIQEIEIGVSIQCGLDLLK